MPDRSSRSRRLSIRVAMTLSLGILAVCFQVGTSFGDTGPILFNLHDTV